MFEESHSPSAAHIQSHRLVLPADANHHGTLFAGSLLRYGLETAYAAASRAVGPKANLMLRRVLSLECRKSVPVGSLVEIRGAVLEVRQGYLVVGVVGIPQASDTLPWMDGLFGFAQVDDKGLPVSFPETVKITEDESNWEPLRQRLEKLRRIRGATGEWMSKI